MLPRRSQRGVFNSSVDVSIAMWLRPLAIEAASVRYGGACWLTALKSATLVVGPNENTVLNRELRLRCQCPSREG
jgi:hypothetical protein